MAEIIAKNKQTGKSFSIFKGTEMECREELVGLKFSQLEPDSGLHLKDYEFSMQGDSRRQNRVLPKHRDFER